MDRAHGRRILLAELAKDWRWEKVPADRFTLFVAADASGTRDEILWRYAQDAVAAGCEYVCAWGAGCERVHDCFDDVNVERTLEHGEAGDTTFMSTWHDDDSLAEALYFGLVNALVTDAGRLPDQSDSFVAVVQHAWFEETRSLLVDQEKLARLFVGNEK